MTCIPSPQTEQTGLFKFGEAEGAAAIVGVAVVLGWMEELGAPVAEVGTCVTLGWIDAVGADITGENLGDEVTGATDTGMTTDCKPLQIQKG